MGLSGSLIHFLLKTILTSMLMWIFLFAIIGVPYDKIGMVLIGTFIINVIASLLSSVLLNVHRGY
jgi:uncharacterized membrane protein YvlD (DUF360 family)